MKTKKKVLGIYISNFEIDTRYFLVADEKQNTKKSLRVIAFLNSLKGAIFKQSLDNHDLNAVTIFQNNKC